jgi:hypothetical protein
MSSNRDIVTDGFRSWADGTDPFRPVSIRAIYDDKDSIACNELWAAVTP